MIYYIYLLISSACSLLLVHLLKLGESRNLRMLNTLTVNYLVAGIFAFTFGSFPAPAGEGLSLLSQLLFTVLVGGCYIGNFLAYSKSIHLNGMGVSVAAMRLSILVPVIASVVLYGEILTFRKVAGLILVFLSLALLLPHKRSIRFEKSESAWLLLVVFVLTGFADVSLKVYLEDFSLHMDELGFMALVFGFAFLIGLIMCLIRKGALITGKEFVIGTLIGIPNLYSSIFLIYALGGIEGSEAYPAVNILNVVGGTLLGLWYWKDRVVRWQWAGFGIAIFAILLLARGS